MAEETAFSDLKYHNGIPVLAVCTRCQLKFLTPVEMKDSVDANEYLWKKYSEHSCGVGATRT